MQKVIVLCNVPHTIEQGVCALCERDEAKAKLEAAEKMAEILKYIHREFEPYHSVFHNQCGVCKVLVAWNKAGKGE